MSNEIKQGDKVKVSKDAPKLYAKGWLHDWCNTDSIVKEVDNEDAVIAPVTRANYELAIPTQYLVKVDAEAFRLADVVSDAGLHQDNYLNEDKKEPKYHKGDRVKFKNIYELKKVKDKSFRWMLVMFASKEATITAVEDNGFYRVDIGPSIGGINDDMIECKVEPTEQTEAQKANTDSLVAEIDKLIEGYRKAFADSFDWQRYEADLAKEVAVMFVRTHRNDLNKVAKMSVDIAKSVVEGLKRK